MDTIKAVDIKYLSMEYALTQICSINSQEQITEYQMYHHQSEAVYKFDPRDFSKELILRFNQSTDINSYNNSVKVSKDLRRIQKLPNHNHFVAEFESFFPNPRNLNQVISLNLAVNKHPEKPTGEIEFYETLLIFHVFAQSKKEENAEVEESHLVTLDSKPFKGWANDNYTLGMIGKYYFLKNLTDYVLIDSKNYTVLEFGKLENICKRENFAGYDPVANKAYFAEYNSSDATKVEYKVLKCEFDPSSNIADDTLRNALNKQELESPVTKKDEALKKSAPVFRVLMKVDDESDTSDTDSNSGDKQPDLFQTIVSKEKTAKV